MFRYRPSITILIYSTAVLTAFGSCNRANTISFEDKTTKIWPKVRYLEPDAETGISKATVTEDVPLAFTNQLFPFNSTGELVGVSNLEKQVDQIMENAETVLNTAGSNFEGLVRIHVYLTEDKDAEKVLERIRHFLPNGVFPAITFVSGGAARSDSMVSMDFVAVASVGKDSKRVELHNADNIFNSSIRSDVAVMAPGRKIFISGQAERGENLSEATIKTMQDLFATLAFAGSTASDIVQIKAFISPVENAEAIEEDIASFFRGRKAPPIISVEWVNDPDRVEIELIASAPAESFYEEIGSYYSPTWMSQATTFSRIVDVESGGLLFTSGLYGETGEEDGEAKDIFKALTRLLKKAGSDYDHLVKATYYPSTDAGRESLVTVRREYYNPDKPPAASLVKAQGVGRKGSGLVVDFVAIVP